MKDLIGYDEIIENSMRSVIHEALKKIEKGGMLGEHYFIITFLTHFPGVVVPKVLVDRYPVEMTVVIQYQYKNLVVEKDHFKVALSFSGKYEKLVVPYKAITSFADPSMNFGLRFSVNYSEFEEEGGDAASKTKNKDSEEIDLSAKVISLDMFRKNKDGDSKSPPKH